MSVDLHRQAEFWMGEMDRAKSKGDYQAAGRCAGRAAEYEEEALAALRDAAPKRVQTIAILELSARSLRVVATEYASRRRPAMTWRCDTCAAEFDYFTYGGPCPGEDSQGCAGELQRRKVVDREKGG